MTDNNNGRGSLTGEKYLFENLNEEARANSLGNPITQLFGKKVRLTASGAWRGVAVEDIDSLDSPHSRDTDCAPITWKSNIAKISKTSTLSSRISSLRVVLDETTPLLSKKRNRRLLLVSQRNSCSFVWEREGKGFERSMPGSMDESWKRIYDNGNALSVTENFQRDCLLRADSWRKSRENWRTIRERKVRWNWFGTKYVRMCFVFTAVFLADRR